MTTLDTREVAPLNEAPAASDDDPDDSGYGWAMFFGFTVAVISISLAVCVLALAPSWWVLGAAVATHLGVTTAMLKIVLGAFGPDSEAYPDLERAESVPPTEVPARIAPGLPLAAHH